MVPPANHSLEVMTLLLSRGSGTGATGMAAWGSASKELGPRFPWGAFFVLLAIRLGTAYFEAAEDDDEHGDDASDDDHDDQDDILHVHLTTVKDLAPVFKAL